MKTLDLAIFSAIGAGFAALIWYANRAGRNGALAREQNRQIISDNQLLETRRRMMQAAVNAPKTSDQLIEALNNATV